MLGKHLFSLIFNGFSIFALVGFQKYFGKKIATLACTTHFMHSLVMLSTNWQYSSIASTFIPYASIKNVAMHFWIEDKPNFFAQSHLCKKVKS
jgi:hypothetical protein